MIILLSCYYNIVQCILNQNENQNKQLPEQFPSKQTTEQTTPTTRLHSEQSITPTPLNPTMAKQPTLTDSLLQLLLTPSPFSDLYLLLIIRFLIYIYLLIEVIDILLGFGKPNVKARVLRKFQLVYGERILREMDRDDMQELEVTISNTILNATKELKVGGGRNSSGGNRDSSGGNRDSNRDSYGNNRDSNHHQTHPNDSNTSTDTITSNPNPNSTHLQPFPQSERRSLRHSDPYPLQSISSTITSTSSTLSRKSLRLKFDLDRNEYFDPPSVLLPSEKSSIQMGEERKEQEGEEFIEEREERRKQEEGEEVMGEEEEEIMEGECEEETLSPTNRSTNKAFRQLYNNNNPNPNNSNPKPLNQTRHPSTPATKSSSHHSPPQQHQPTHQANIHYPQQQLTGMDLSIEQKLIKNEENLLHLSDGGLNSALMGREEEVGFFQGSGKSGSEQGNYDGQVSSDNREQFEGFTSIIKSETTKPTDSYIEEVDSYIEEVDA